MKSVFTQSKYVQEALTIEKYGAVSKVRNSSLEAGIKRLCKHFDQMCNSEHFKDSPYVFAVIVDKVRSDNVDAMPKHRVNDLLDELTQKISWTYLHVPRSCVFQTIGSSTTRIGNVSVQQLYILCILYYAEHARCSSK